MNVKKFLLKQLLKRDLRKAFRNADLYIKRKAGKEEVKVYPKIHSATFNHESKITTYVFTLLNGMDPKEIKKKEYVFQQHFGPNIEMEGEVKKFVLTIYGSTLPTELPYSFTKIQPVVAPFKMGVICGMDRYGQYVAFDLTKQPHILIAGETGSGKSTQLRSILTTFIKTKRPEELKIFLGDCKKSEFHIFRKVEHVECVHSKARDIEKMLKGIKQELDERSQLTEVFEVGHVDDLPDEHKKPYLLVCIDEFVMLRNNENIMEILIEIAAIGRTLGVFLILSMQRPNAKVLDTTVRANLTVSMGFKLRDKTESRIVNTPNAEKMDVSGRFIMNSHQLYELQAPYLTMEKAKALLNPFMVLKGPTKEVHEVQEAPKPLTERDVFLDAFDKA
jgi:DNA segregation ATPase FtsK/SpoIIIE, S-DNA-T family